MRFYIRSRFHALSSWSYGKVSRCSDWEENDFIAVIDRRSNSEFKRFTTYT